MGLTIVWPSGQKDTVTNLKPNQSITVQEGKGIVASHAIIFQQATSERMTLAVPPALPTHGRMKRLLFGLFPCHGPARYGAPTGPWHETKLSF